MHPLDQFRAFQMLRDGGMSDEEIAARHFVTTAIVKQRLRLASVSPRLHEVYADDGMTLEQLMAFSVTADLARQEQAWDNVSRSQLDEPYLAFLFRTINGLVAAPMALEFGLGPGDLGLLTSIYFLTFAAAQIPVGIVLDRDGPRRIQSALLLVVAAGSALFASSDSFLGLLGARALIGFGVAAALTAGLQSLILWFPKHRVPFLNGIMLMLGGLGAVTATLPGEFVLSLLGWRGLFDLLAALAAACAALIYLVVPDGPPAKPIMKDRALVSLRKIYATRPSGALHLCQRRLSARPGRSTVFGPRSGSATSRDLMVPDWCSTCSSWLLRSASVRSLWVS